MSKFHLRSGSLLSSVDLAAQRIFQRINLEAIFVQTNVIVKVNIHKVESASFDFSTDDPFTDRLGVFRSGEVSVLILVVNGEIQAAFAKEVVLSVFAVISSADSDQITRAASARISEVIDQLVAAARVLSRTPTAFGIFDTSGAVAVTRAFVSVTELEAFVILSRCSVKSVLEESSWAERNAGLRKSQVAQIDANQLVLEEVSHDGQTGAEGLTVT